MPITKATQSVITPNIVTTDTRQTIAGEKVIQCLYDTTSTTSLTIGIGSKTLTVGTGLTWVAGRVATIRNGTSTTRFMTGSVTSYDPATGVMVVNVTTVGSGTGTYTSWVVIQSSTTALPALRITSNDTGANAFVVEDSTNPDSTPFAILTDGSVRMAGGTNTGSNQVSIGSGANWFDDFGVSYSNSIIIGDTNGIAINPISIPATGGLGGSRSVKKLVYLFGSTSGAVSLTLDNNGNAYYAKGTSLFEVTIIGAGTSTVDGTLNGSYVYKRQFPIRYLEGAVTTLGTITTLGTDFESNAAANVAITLGLSNEINVTVTGVASQIIDWSAHLEVVQIG
jgi:hypothetical protein